MEVEFPTPGGVVTEEEEWVEWATWLVQEKRGCGEEGCGSKLVQDTERQRIGEAVASDLLPIHRQWQESLHGKPYEE